MPKPFYRRVLPHMQRDYRPLFVTFCTYLQRVLPEEARSIVMNCCLHDHEVKLLVYAAVVMPDHVHMVFSPMVNVKKKEFYSLAEIMDAIKGASAHKVNGALGWSGHVWQEESFDHVLRCSESVDAKVEYIRQNPVRRGLVSRWEDYPWFWERS
jgi:REP element-mobilizing transposase RayT